MESIKDQLSLLSEDIRDITDNIVRLKSVGNDSPVVYEELVDLIQSQFRHVESDVQTIHFETEDTLSGSEREKCFGEIGKINEDIKMQV